MHPAGTGSTGQGGSSQATPGTVNTGGGGGGDQDGPVVGRAGGSGIVVVRCPGVATVTVSPGTNTVSTIPSGFKVATFTVSGNLTIS